MTDQPPDTHAEATVEVPQQVLDDFVDVLREWSAMPCPSFTCSEAERLADLARAVGANDVAAALISAHAEADEEGDLHFGLTEEDAS